MQTATPIKLSLFLLLFLMLCGMQASAQSGNVLYEEVEAAKQRGTQFTEYNLFSYTGPATMLDGGSLLTPQALQIATLYNEKPSAITIQIPSANGRYTLSMLHGNVCTENMLTTTEGKNGTQNVSIDKGVHYTGCIEGQAHTLATMSVFANGDVMILFANKDGNYVLGALQDNSNRYILYRDDAIQGLPPFQCKLKTDNTDTPYGEKTTGASGTCKIVTAYVEGDYDLYKHFNGNLIQVENYLIGLFGQMRGLYKNDSILLMLESMSIWTIPDRYKDTTSEHALKDFMSVWNKRNDTFHGNIALLIAKDTNNNGGISSLKTLCKKNLSYAYIDVQGSYKTIPTYSKEVMVLSHETAHLIGCNHTHWCGWNTGPGKTCGAIDDCAQLEGSGLCGTCPTQYTNNAPTAAWSGTIMSYCHLKARGINFANGFGPLPAADMRNIINDKNTDQCLRLAIIAKLKVDNICRGYGSIIVEFDTNYVNNQTLPPSSLLYYWTPTGATTQNLYNITTPGIYGVNITDGNGNCQIQYNTVVATSNTDSCRFKLQTGTTNSSAQNISISPNPCKGICDIKYAASDNALYTITVYDIMGKALLSVNTQYTSHTTINTAELPNGTYILGIRGDRDAQFVRFVVQ